MNKKIASAALASAFALAACGGASSAPSTTTQATNAPAPTVAVATQPAATQPAGTQPAASAPAVSGQARKIAVTATNSLYSISTLEVKPGEKIEFVLTNTGDEKHNMVGVGEGISLVSPDFDAGQTVSWIWTAPTKLGTFKLICAFHKDIPPVQVTVK